LSYRTRKFFKLFKLQGESIPLGTPASFSDFYERTHLPVFRYLYGLTGGPQEDVEDLTAEAFTRAWRARRNFQGDADAALGRQRPDGKPSIFTASDFSFDTSKQVYLCPQGKELTCHAHNQVNRYRTFDVYHARVEDCAACPLRSRCLSKSTASRRYLSIQVDTEQPNPIDEMKAKIDTEQGKRIYARRLGIVEPVFANICGQKHMNRFMLRSKLKVDVQWRLFALVHNVGKIHVFGALT